MRDESGVEAKKQSEGLREKLARGIKVEKNFIPKAILKRGVDPSQIPYKMCANCQWIEEDILGNHFCTIRGMPITRDAWNGTRCKDRLWKPRRTGQVAASQ